MKFIPPRPKNMTRCPTCNGCRREFKHKKSGGISSEVCWRCDGNGSITERKFDWYKRGKKFKRSRVYLKIRSDDMAKKIGISVRKLLLEEEGRINPVNLKEEYLV